MKKQNRFAYSALVLAVASIYSGSVLAAVITDWDRGM